MTHDVIVVLAALGIVGQIAAVVLIAVAILAAVGVRGPLRSVREMVWGYELWLAFVVALVSTLGSLFLSEVAHFIPCEMCWFQRIFMYPLAIVVPLMAVARDTRATRYVLPLPVVGAGFSIYHLLIEHGIIEQTRTCLISAPGGCATKWMNEFGYVTIPTLALTGFVLLIVLLSLAWFHDEHLYGEDDAVAPAATA